MLKKSLWPELYYAKARIYNPRDGQLVQRMLPFLLLNGVLHALAEHADPELLLFCCWYGRTYTCPSSCNAVGLWGDGVPMNNERTESLEIVSILLPGLPAPYRNLRVPVFALSKRFFAKGETYEDILQVVAWSFTMCVGGHWPKQRHDGQEFLRTDRNRKQLSRATVGMPRRSLRGLGGLGVL